MYGVSRNLIILVAHERAKKDDETNREMVGRGREGEGGGRCYGVERVTWVSESRQ